MSTEYTLTINPDGSVQKKIDGIQGPGCMDDPLSKRLDAAFGKPVRSDKTSSYYAQTTGEAHVNARG